MGILITIDGLDASGKETQSNLLCEALRARGKRVRLLSFPMYGERSAVPVEMYLSGALGGEPTDTNAYAASSFFSVDRYISFRTDWCADLADPDTVVVTNRYTTANAVHQLSKLPRDQWEGFLAWLWDFEFDKLGLPRPNCILYLEMRPDISRRLLAARSAETGRAQDIHERSCDHLERSYEAALYAAETLGWHKISCWSGDDPRPIPDIHAEIMRVIAPYLTF